MIAPEASAREALRRAPALIRGLLETAIVAVGLAAVVLFAALATYSPEDPGFNDMGSSTIHNGVGPVGARVADFLFFYFGRPAFLIPLVFVLPLWMLYRRLKGGSPRVHPLIRIVGFVLLLTASCGLASLHWANWPRPDQSAGGWVGADVGRDGLGQSFGSLGATLVLLAVWMAGLSLTLRVSWFTIMDRIGAWVLSGFGVVRTPRPAPVRRPGIPVTPAAVQTPAYPQQPAPPVRSGTVAASPSRMSEPAVAAGVEERTAHPGERPAPVFDPPPLAELPGLDLLDDPPAAPEALILSDERRQELSTLVEEKLREFGIKAEVVDVQPGPVVTRVELRPAPGVKASQITSLSKDLARALKVRSVRVVEVIAGKDVMGLEIANERRALVGLKEIIRSGAYEKMSSPLAVGLGKDIGGQPMVRDLAAMPHLLIAGTTGSGKSVMINAMVLSLLYKARPEDVRLIMIDPKMLELSLYDGIPHLLTPVVTDMRLAANALAWCVAEVERRFKLMADLKVRSIAGFNAKVREHLAAGQPLLDPLAQQRVAGEAPQEPPQPIPVLTPLPYVVVIIDELADLMMTVGKKMDELIARLTQKARASGIHLVLATQRPSVDVITGLIKANIPSRIAFQVSSKVDSRTILDQSGAETLLGHGDMLYLPTGTSNPVRVHGAFVSDKEVHRVAEDLRSKSSPRYLDEILAPQLQLEESESAPPSAPEPDKDLDPLYDEAVRIVTTDRKPSISYVQRKLKIGYNRAARLLEAMESAGLVSSLQSNGAREVLAPAPSQEE